MRKQVQILFILIAFLSLEGFSQNCPAVPVIDENFNTQPDPNNISVLPECWGLVGGSASVSGGEIELALLGSSNPGTLVSPNVRNGKGVLTFRARKSSSFTVYLSIGYYSGGFVELQQYTLPGNYQNYTFDYASHAASISSETALAFKITSGPNSGVQRLRLDDINYVSKCENPGNPTAIAKDIELSFGPGETSVTLNPSLLNDGSVDDCGLPVASFSADKTTFTCDDLGVNIVSFTVTDDRGATDNVLANVTIKPFLGFSIPAFTDIQLDENGELNYTVEELKSDLSSDCAGLTYTVDKLNFTCADLGVSQNITLTASYNGDVINELTQKLFLRDTISPKNIVANDLNVTLDAGTGMADILPEDLLTSATDNCTSMFTLAASKTSFSCSDVGDNVVLLSVTDESGNTTTEEVIVTVSSTISDQTLSTSATAFCPDGSANAVTVDMASSELEVNYFLRNSVTDAVLDGPVAGTGGALSFNPGSFTETTSVYVFAQADAEAPDFGLDFDGVNDKVSTTYTQAATSEQTIEGWIYPRAATTNMILSNYDDGGLEAGDMFFDNQGNFPYTGRALRINFIGAGADRHILVVEDVLTLNDWNHIAATFDNGAVKLFVDGVEVASNTANFTTLPAANSTSTFAQHTAATSTPFDGQMDEFRIWNIARTATEIVNNKDTRLTGSETGLAAYYSFDNGTGTILADLVNGFNGTLTNMDASSDWINGVQHVESNICDVRMSTEITFGDGELPTAIAQNISGQLDETGNFTVTASELNNGSSDNCTSTENLVLSLDQTDFDCTMIGENDVTLSVTDESGNTATASAIVTIISAVDDQTVSASETNICPGTETMITMEASQSGFEYILYNAADDTNVDGPITADGGPVNFSTGLLSESRTFYVAAGESANSMEPHFALDFDGINDRVATSYVHAATNELTIEAWIYPRATTTNKFISNYNDSGSLKPGDMFFDNYNASANNGRGLRMSLNGDTGSRLALGVANVLELNSWNHIAFTFDNGAAKLYVDGMEVATGTASFTSVPEAVSDMWFGEDSGNSEQDHFNGRMDDVRFWNTARTAGEILANKDAELFGSELNLAAYFNFNEGSGFFLTEHVNGAHGSLESMNSTSDWVAGAPISSKVLCKSTVGSQITITVEDTEVPVVLTQNASLILDNNGNAVITAADIDNGSTDNCTAVENLNLSLDVTDFDINDVGDNTVTLSVTDANGNVGTATATVTISDKEQQTISFAGVVDKTFGDPNFTITASVDSSLPVTFSIVSGGISITENSEEATENNVETFTITGAGTAVIRASNDGNEIYASLEEDIVIEVAKADQIITVEEVTTKTVTAEPIAINASVDTELALNYSVTGPATVIENIVTLDGTEGTVSVTVSQAGTDNYNQASESISFDVVAKQAQTIDFTDVPDLTYGAEDQTLSATSSSTLAVNFNLISGPATLTGSTLSVTGAGDIVVEAVQSGDDNFLAASVRQTITVSRADLTISADNQTINYGEAIPTLTYQFSGFVNGEAEENLNATIRISTTAGGEEGQTNAGSYPISILVTGSEAGDNYNFNTVDATLTVDKIDQIITITEIENKEPTSPSFDVIATIDSGLGLTYEVTGPATIAGSIITLDGAEGTVTVTVSQVGDINRNAASASASFEVARVLTIGEELSKSIKIYPNPVTNYIMIDSDELVNLKFYGLNGQLIKEFNQVNGRVDMSSIKMGTYLMEVSNAEEQITLKINKAN